MAAWATRAATGTTVRSLYNRSANNIGNVHITNVYNRTVINNTTTHVSYNGGQGGIAARPTQQQLAYEHAQHNATPLQVQHQQAAGSNRALLASVNNGRPPIAATARPAAFTGPGVVPARAAGGPYHPTPAAANAEHGAPGPAITHPSGWHAGAAWRDPGAADPG